MNDAIEKIAFSLSYEPSWQDFGPSLDLMSHIESFSRSEYGPKVFVACGEPGCGMTSALQRHYFSAVNHSIWIGSRLLDPKATFLHRIGSYMGVYLAFQGHSFLPTYLWRALELRGSRLIYIDDAGQYMLGSEIADDFFADLSLLLERVPILRIVLGVKAPQFDMGKKRLLNRLACETHDLKSLGEPIKMAALVAMIGELNVLSGTNIKLNGQVSLCRSNARNLGELVDWVRLAFATAWVEEKLIDLNASCADLWKVLDDFFE